MSITEFHKLFTPSRVDKSSMMEATSTPVDLNSAHALSRRSPAEQTAKS
jgi:hypothetical protein